MQKPSNRKKSKVIVQTIMKKINRKLYAAYTQYGKQTSIGFYNAHYLT